MNVAFNPSLATSTIAQTRFGNNDAILNVKSELTRIQRLLPEGRQVITRGGLELRFYDDGTSTLKVVNTPDSESASVVFYTFKPDGDLMSYFDQSQHVQPQKTDLTARKFSEVTNYLMAFQ